MTLEGYAANFIKRFEGYSSTPKWDVNAWRIGHGSSTIELPNGTHRKVIQSDVTTREYAQKDIERRIKNEFIPKVKETIGENYYKQLPAGAKIALVSLAYNYGNVTKQAIIKAARSGNIQSLSDSIIDSTYNDNQDPQITDRMREALRRRRRKEAALVLTTVVVSSGIKITLIIFAILLLLVFVFIFALIKYYKQKKQRHA